MGLKQILKCQRLVNSQLIDAGAKEEIIKRRKWQLSIGYKPFI
jgi:hypothetical protein